MSLYVLPVPNISSEDFWVGVAKAAYVKGDISLEQFEEDVEAMLRGGAIPGYCIPGGLPSRGIGTKGELR